MKENKYNPILDTPPDSFGGVKVKTNFRQVLEFFRVVENPEINEEEKATIIINIFFDELPKFDGDKTWDFIKWYITLGEEQTGRSGKQCFCWNTDAGRLYAAFLQVYKIDLLTADLHWWTFKDLFDSLPTGTKLQDVIDIRLRKIDPKNSTPESRAELVRLKEIYKIDGVADNNQFPI